MVDGDRTYSVTGYLTSRVVDDNGDRTVDTKYHLQLDLDELVRLLAPAALVASTNPKRATRLHESVTLTVLEETRVNL